MSFALNTFYQDPIILLSSKPPLEPITLRQMESLKEAWNWESMVFDRNTMRKSPQFGTDHDQHILQSGLLKTNFGDMCDRYYGFQTEAGKSADPRTLRLLEFFRELYYRRRETFRKMVPDGLHEEFVELFKRISSLLTIAKSKREARTMQRSLSAGSKLKLDRFKVRSVNVGSGDVQSIGQGGQGDRPKVVGSK